MYIYESSPRRSPRHVARTDGNVLKVKAGSPIRKGKVGQGGRKVLSSSAALASVTGTGQKRRKQKVNDENKENSSVVPRTRGTGVNGSTMVDGKKKKVPLGTKTERGRLPLKELPLNGFLEKGEGVSSVEIVVLVPRVDWK
jgi:hypothetical protein